MGNGYLKNSRVEKSGMYVFIYIETVFMWIGYKLK